MENIRLKVLGSIFLIAVSSSCAHIPENRLTLQETNPPKWVLKGGGAYNDPKGKAFYGVGSATGIKNFSLQRTVADDRARNDLAKVFDFWTKSLSKDYMAHTNERDFSKASEEQNIEVAIKTVTSATLSGVIIIDHWEHPYRNELFSLARLNLEKFKKNLDKYNELSQEVLDAVKQRADKLHEELEKEVKKKDRKV